MSNNSPSFLQSSLGKKFLMGITGLFLIIFLIVHCAINACIFFNDGGVTFNAAAEFMGTNILIRTMEIVLFVGIIVHIVQALVLTLQNNKARPVKYAVNNGQANSKWYSRWMGLLGTLILMFLIVHLNHFWMKTRFTGLDHKTLFEQMQDVFSQLWVVILYTLSMISLAYHLMHGFASAFQTMGWNHPNYAPLILKTGLVFSIVVPLIFALMPIAMYFKWVH
ncbi:MAG TPA: succinate dehydrogenase cytochrome b subunit [Bacteroidia bacterium]|jgi:succinate dehydrogenase / fumarate reductase cytochrome b subunit|nr:succinate dehydrogenase cytochrome b subunit [Bacteroidia bacterium]